MFCVKSDIKAKTFKGINLNTLPNTERVKFFEAYYRQYKIFFKDIEKITENNELALNKEYLRIALSKDGQDIIKLFSTTASANFNYGYRSYKMLRLKG